jgi:hypothetical protein
MATILNRTTTFATNGTVTAAGLHNLIDDTAIYAGLITTQTELTTVGTADQLLIAVGGVSDTGAPRRATVQNLFDDALTSGTYTNAQISGALTYGTATGNRTVSTSATITTGTIPNLTSSTANITLGTITNLSSGTTNSTSVIATSGTIATLNSTTGTIGNLSTTLAGDFTISQGTGTLGTTAVTAGSYGSVSAIPFITVDSKGRVTAATTGTFSSTPADGSITPAKLSQPFTRGTAVATTSGTAIDFTSIPSWVKRITVMFNQSSAVGSSSYLIQIGSGSISSIGYVSTSNALNQISASDGVNSTSGFIMRVNGASNTLSGIMHITNISGNIWISSHVCKLDTAVVILGAGDCTISGVLDRVRITNTTPEAFDAGSVNIMYEG